MARVAPSDLTRLMLGARHRSEVETLQILQRRLPDNYLVFHSVHWTREYRSSTAFGEVDFVITNQTGRVLVIEQKNGQLKETVAGLVAPYVERDRVVGEQVHRALDGLRDKFKRLNPKQLPLHLDYLIYCPDHRLVGLNAAGLDTSRIVDASKSRDLTRRIQELLDHDELAPPERRAVLEDFFLQAFDLVPDVHAHVAAQGKSFARLSGGLRDAVRNLEMSPFRLRVYGVAGCGKTLVARDFFERALDQGKRTLLLCFNRPLSERLRLGVRDGGQVTTWYGLCADLLARHGEKLDFQTMRGDPQFWDRVAEQVTERASVFPREWDAVVVDEGQDFEPLWTDILWALLRHGADVLWLEDPYQNLRRQPPIKLDGFVGYRARVNYRTPRSIAAVIQRMLPAYDFDSGSDLPGLGVGLTTYSDPTEQPKLVARVVTDLVRDGFRHEDIVILTTRHTVTPGAERSVFSAISRAGNYTLRRFVGKYDLLGNQLKTHGQLTFESVTRFKGQEAPAVILVDIDPLPGEEEYFEQLLFSGMTRATVRLEMVMRSGTAALLQGLHEAGVSPR